MKKYCIKDGYKINNKNIHYDMTKESNRNRYQIEVYQFIKKFMIENNYKSVFEIGCGTGHKIIDYLGDFNTIGSECEPCFSYLNKNYPNRQWILSKEKKKSFTDIIITVDIVICIDVIEHIYDPDLLLNYIKNKTKSNKIIISTPDRNKIADNYNTDNNKNRRLKNRAKNGPPLFECHVREWTFDEFEKYIGIHFKIEQHLYCNKQKECQFIVCSRY